MNSPKVRIKENHLEWVVFMLDRVEEVSNLSKEKNIKLISATKKFI